LSLEKTENMDLNNEDFVRADEEPDDVGRALSLALKLKKRNNGTSQTQIPKKVAISVKPGALETGPRCL